MNKVILVILFAIYVLEASSYSEDEGIIVFNNFTLFKDEISNGNLNDITGLTLNLTLI